MRQDLKLKGFYKRYQYSLYTGTIQAILYCLYNYRKTISLGISIFRNALRITVTAPSFHITIAMKNIPNNWSKKVSIVSPIIFFDARDLQSSIFIPATCYSFITILGELVTIFAFNITVSTQFWFSEEVWVYCITGWYCIITVKKFRM